VDYYGGGRTTWTLVTAPAAEPVTLGELKQHLRLEHDLLNDPLTSYLTAARQYVEKVCDVALLTQTWRLTLDGWPSDGVIRPPRGPLQSVTSIVYDATDGTAATLTASAYRVDADGGRVVPAWGTTWPSARAQAGAVRITYVAGWASAALVPEDAKHCIKLLASLWFANNVPVTQGAQAGMVPHTVEMLLASLWSGAYR
jgi:uncharacterized phiE125 gp8 family phage protein